MGYDAKSLVNFPELTSMPDTIDLSFNECVRIGDDLRINALKTHALKSFNKEE